MLQRRAGTRENTVRPHACSLLPPACLKRAKSSVSAKFSAKIFLSYLLLVLMVGHQAPTMGPCGLDLAQDPVDV